MSSTAISQVDQALALRAYSTFTVKRQLIVHINRQKSSLTLPTCDAPLMISRNLYNHCLEDVTPKTQELGQYFFSDLNGRTCYMNQETVDEFTKITRTTFPDFKYTRLFALVDNKTDIELMPDTVIPKGFATDENFNPPAAMKVRAFVGKLIPDVDSDKSLPVTQLGNQP